MLPKVRKRFYYGLQYKALRFHSTNYGKDMYLQIVILCFSKRCPDAITLVAAICSIKDIY